MSDKDDHSSYGSGLENCPIINSEMAVKVLKNLAISEKGDYGSNLARKLDKSQASVSRIINELRECGFIEKGRREKAQYYKVDYDSIADFWYTTLYTELQRVEGDINRRKWLAEGYIDKEEMITGMERYDEEIKDIFAEYVEEVLENNRFENMTVENLLFESFAFSIGHNMIKRDEFLEDHPELEHPKDALVYLWNLDGFAQELDEVLN